MARSRMLVDGGCSIIALDERFVQKLCRMDHRISIRDSSYGIPKAKGAFNAVQTAVGVGDLRGRTRIPNSRHLTCLSEYITAAQDTAGPRPMVLRKPAVVELLITAFVFRELSHDCICGVPFIRDCLQWDTRRYPWGCVAMIEQNAEDDR